MTVEIAVFDEKAPVARELGDVAEASDAGNYMD